MDRILTDWQRRDDLEALQLLLRRMVQDINRFSDEARNRLATLNQKLVMLERNIK
ncbi:hypothetical protein THRCLA_21555 [Thraustotheca clavata]|uniref:Uncharacterized protein n=1 Tax=Thraustotheca clavata TaxID=74557 RepID=A0A1V9ZVD4_9STRA|nr:hypothetical protein THRCLA_21555 [Thraustotheca clavata]